MVDLDVAYVAKLARLNLTPQELDLFAHQLQEVLNYCNKLQQMDVEGLEPMSHPWPIDNVLAEDVAQAPLNAQEALQNAPAREGNFFSVPQVV